MKVKVFVNWNTQEVCSEKDLEKEAKERAADIYEDEYAFDEFLEEEMSSLSWIEIFEMTAETKKEIMEKWKDRSSYYAKDEIEEEWKGFDLEI